jgi:outer membrane protein OmpA-like peptidoglycan-associated protein
MVVSETGAQPSCAKKPGQAGIRGSAMLAAVGWLLAGCSTISAMNPVNWWHRQEGGKIAEDRPAPPNADQPYPNMDTVPTRPEPPDQDAMKKLTDSLVADRTNAQHAAESTPLADPSSPAASPGLFGVGTAPPPAPPGTTPPPKSASAGTPVASASIPAVTAPAGPAAPPSPAPRKPVQSAPLEPLPAPTVPAPARDAASAAPPAGAAPPVAAAPPAGAAPSAAATPPAGAASPAAAAVPVGPPPALPAGPPPRPAVAPPAPAAVVAPTPMPAPSSGTSATIVFVERTANLSPPAADEVKTFAGRRGKGTISVVGYGDAASSEPDAQSAALNLGLSRAQTIVDVLKAAGVPGNAIRVSAEASGRGASLQVLQ